MQKTEKMKNSAYIIDKKYQIQRFNQEIRSFYPELQKGDVCYRKLMGEDCPCQMCPIQSLSQEGDLYYNKVINSWVDCTAAPIDLEDGTEGYVIVCHPLTQMREDQKQQALHQLEQEDKERDERTGLYNREAFFQKVAVMLKASKPSEYCMVALDIENFKLYNSWYGFEKGNDFLRYIGYCMKEISRDIGLSGYVGEDNFVAFLPNQEKVLEDLLERLKFYIDSREESVGFYPAMGIYVIDDVSMPLLDMYDRASTARIYLRGNHMSRMNWYDESMIQDMEEEHQLLNELKRGLEKDEFDFYLQPKCDMTDGSIIGMEALCRWKHPDKGVLNPGTFITRMEMNGLITALDRRIWEKVCATMKDWRDTDKKMIPISINVSRIDFRELDVVRNLEGLVRKYQIPKELLEIEVTESAYAKNEILVKRTVEELRKRGFTVAMDDFGSGYSSLNMLRYASVDILKIDMRFLQLEDESNDRGVQILEMIVQLAKTLHIKVIAEGVETRKHRELLLQMGCNYAQGYYYYKPLERKEAEQLLERSTVSEMKLPETRESVQNQIDTSDVGKFLARLSDLEADYQSQKDRVRYYEMAMNELFDDRIELDYRGFSKDELTKNTLILMEKKWELSFAAREKIRKLINSKDTSAGNTWVPVKKSKITTEDYRQLMLALAFIDERKSILYIRDQGEQSAEQIMVKHPLVRSYDYNVAKDELQISARDEDGEIKVRVIKNCLDNIRALERLGKTSREMMEKTVKKALQAPIFGTLEYEVEESPDQMVWKRMYYASLADHKGKIYRMIGMAGNIDREYKDKEFWKEKAARDSMTGFLNHNVALEHMEDALLSNGNGTLIALDIDNFKQINDSIGHIQGDEFIRKFADLLRSVFRKNDIIGRTGGDEFLIFMPQVGRLEVAKQRIQDLISMLDKIKVPHVGTVRCSVGIATAEQKDESIKQLLKQADYALYEAKNAGKGHYVTIESGKTVHHGLTSLQKIPAKDHAAQKQEYEMAGKLFHLLHHAPTKEKGINQALAYLGETMDVSRVYILEIEDNREYVNNTYEWCAEGISPEIEQLQKMKADDLGFDLDSHFAKDNMWLCPDVSLVQETGMRQLLEAQNIKSLLHWAFRKDQVIQGMIGFDECRENIIWNSRYTNVLKDAGMMIAEYLMFS